MRKSCHRYNIISHMFDATQTMEAQALAAPTLMDSIRFLVEADTNTIGAPDDDSKKNPTTEIIGEKCLVSYVTTTMDSVVGIVLRAIFEASRKDETKVKMEKTGMFASFFWANCIFVYGMRNRIILLWNTLQHKKKLLLIGLCLRRIAISLRRDYLDITEQDYYTSLYSESQAQFNTYVEAGTLMNNYAHIFDLLTPLRQVKGLDIDAKMHRVLLVKISNSALRRLWMSTSETVLAFTQVLATVGDNNST
ncbi:hypothetical protein L1887_18950 [Cichorium endivia]|nr:hypothetical protein L1887_18950 [Cichorium endivia]